MNRLLKLLLIANCFLIPIDIILTPLIINEINNKFNVSSWSEEAQKLVKESNERWSTLMYTIPIIVPNLLVIILLRTNNIQREKI